MFDNLRFHVPVSPSKWEKISHFLNNFIQGTSEMIIISDKQEDDCVVFLVEDCYINFCYKKKKVVAKTVALPPDIPVIQYFSSVPEEHREWVEQALLEVGSAEFPTAQVGTGWDLFKNPQLPGDKNLTRFYKSALDKNGNYAQGQAHYEEITFEVRFMAPRLLIPISEAAHNRLHQCRHCGPGHIMSRCSIIQDRLKKIDLSSLTLQPCHNDKNWTVEVSQPFLDWLAPLLNNISPVDVMSELIVAHVFPEP